jgi:hypothetical protein
MGFRSGRCVDELIYMDWLSRFMHLQIPGRPTCHSVQCFVSKTYIVIVDSVDTVWP